MILEVATLDVKPGQELALYDPFPTVEHYAPVKLEGLKS
jgi:hypothetical protein